MVAAAKHFAKSHDVAHADGARISFLMVGLIRASNTQPVLVLRFEATSRRSPERYAASVERAGSRAGCFRSPTHGTP